MLGIGAAVTLAAWNDSEFATGFFGSGHFNLQGSANGTDFVENPEHSPAELNFTLASGSLSPGDIVVAPFALHLDGETTNDAIVSVLSTVSEGTVAEKLSYGIIEVSDWDACIPGATGDVVVPNTTNLGSVAGPSSFGLRKITEDEKAIGATSGADVILCVQVTASDGLTQTDTEATATWQFVGESVSS